MFGWDNAAYWAKAWQQERSASLYGVEQSDRDGKEWWDKRAVDYASQTAEKGALKKAGDVISMLEHAGYLPAQAVVLDIGCGPGNYALRMAKRVKKVVAVDSSSVMLDILKAKASQEGIDNIETVCLAWEDVEIVKMKWENAFDLVFASLSPGINDVDTLQKMIAASNKACFYKGFANRENHMQIKLWQQLLHREMPKVPADVFFVFHLLFAWGYCPNLNLQRHRIERSLSKVQAVHDLQLAMTPVIQITDEVSEAINRTVEAAMKDECFLYIRDAVEGDIVWEV